MRHFLICFSTLIFPALAYTQDTRSLSFAWDFAPQRYEIDIGGYGREISRSGEFDDSNRAALRYLSDQNNFGGKGNAGWFFGGELAYGEYNDAMLNFESFSINGIVGVFIEPQPWWRLNVHGRFGIAFNQTDISYDLFAAEGIGNGKLNYNTSGLQYAAGASSDFFISQKLLLSVFAGIQGEYASAVDYWYCYCYPSHYVEVETYGASLGAALGYRF